MTAWVTVNGLALEYQWRGPAAAPTIVFLHEGLGCLAMWKDFPARLAAASGCRALVYSRPGYGRSQGSLKGRRPDYLEREAREVLPALLRALAVGDCVLYGHSDGASIALLYAAHALHAPLGLALEAPHVFVEAITLHGIRDAQRLYRQTDLRRRLARYHGARVDDVFFAWHDIWLAGEFADWNIEDRLAEVSCPTLVLQGEDDQYGTAAQPAAIAAGVRGPCTTVLLPDCGHVAHREAADRCLGRAGAFIRKLIAGPGE